MTQPKTIAKKVKRLMQKALKEGKDEVIFTDANGHKLSAIYHYEGEADGAPYFLMEYIEDSKDWEWTEYVQQIELELVEFKD